MNLYYENPEHIKLYQGDVREVLRTLPDEKVDCCITSPPYWALRDYQLEPAIWDGDEKCEHQWGKTQKTLTHKSGETNPGKEGWYKNKGGSDDKGNNFCSLCGAWRGSLGLEPTFELYLKHLCDIFDEVKRVLKKTGTCWVNIGDTYSGSCCGHGQTEESSGFQNVCKQVYYPTSKMKPLAKNTEVPHKSLCMIPFRFAIEMVNRGWILRNTIIWHKRNCMPSSVKDRFTVDFEYVFFFVKSKKYWFEQIFEPNCDVSIKRAEYENHRKNPSSIGSKSESYGMPARFVKLNPQGHNKRCVWTINTKPFKGAHFAVFPEKLVEPMIKAGCPEFVCKKCGKAREAIIKTIFHKDSDSKANKVLEAEARGDRHNCIVMRQGHGFNENIKQGYTDCGCNAGWDSGVIMDIFCGSGTTGVVAKKLNRNFIGIDLKPEYLAMAKQRILNAQGELQMV